MGLWDKIKKVFDTGGVKLRFETPGVFRWQDDALPVVVTLANTTEEPRTVRRLKFEISESDREAPGSKADAKEGSSDDLRTVLTYEHECAIAIEPGAETTVEVAVPLSTGGAVQALDGEGAVPGWLAKVGDAMSSARAHATGRRWYRLTVSRVVEGFDTSSGTTKDIRHLAPGEHVKVWRPGQG
ncbi:MAG TPA: hypothetical protein VK866_15560 [Acidimicrobiales bacterium]|nr:hypothetical protein [Acidimicrobiales bacterium]